MARPLIRRPAPLAIVATLLACCAAPTDAAQEREAQATPEGVTATPEVVTATPEVVTATPEGVSATPEGAPAVAGPAAPKSFVAVTLTGTVDLGMAPLVSRALEEAEESGAGALFLEIDTLGGRVDAALRIRDALMDAKVPTTCWVNERAISAGALICLSAQTIDMRPGSTIGAATPVQIDSSGKASPVDEKMTSYLRKEFGATAEARGRPKLVAEAMVDRDVVIEDVIEGGKLLTLTTNEALAVGFADRSSPDREAALAAAGLADAAEQAVAMNWAERLARIISGPVLSGLLLSIGFLGVLFEVKSPGWGVPGTVGGLSLIAFFAGHHVVQLAGWEDLLLVLLGIVLLLVEVFVIPGFGVAGILGLISLLGGLVMAMIGRNWEAAVALGALREALYTVAGSVLIFAVGLALLLRHLPRASFFRSTLVLSGAAGVGEDSFVYGTPPDALVGRDGVTRTTLRPSGVVEVDGERHDALSEGDLLAAGTHVRVVGARGGSLVVRPIARDADTSATPPDDRVHGDSGDSGETKT